VQALGPGQGNAGRPPGDRLRLSAPAAARRRARLLYPPGSRIVHRATLQAPAYRGAGVAVPIPAGRSQRSNQARVARRISGVTVCPTSG
jgi:hypothetical protein